MTGMLPDGTCVHELVERLAAGEPGRTAVLDGDVVLGYGELNARANRLAHRLLDSGFEGCSVGLLLRRSAEFVVSALAVLKAGGAYVPLDADYPPDRLRMMLGVAGCPVVLTTRELIAAVPGGADVHAIALDDPAPEQSPGTDPGLAVHPDALAYVMFTSGSTGVPKGVMITHRGVVRLVRQEGPARLHPTDVVLHVSSTSFDAATFDIWGALTGGAALAVAPAGRLSATDIGALIRRHGATCALFPTGLFHVMVDERLSELAGMRLVMAGGDVLAAGHADRFARAFPDCELLNVYGPTEITSLTTYHRVRPGEEQNLPIGRAMTGTTVRVLDEELRQVPRGTAGQLFAGGHGIARGYLDDPALTAERFVPDPWNPGARMYATGDLGRERADGTLEFLGRMDHQFKKRGFRVEPAEVETALRADAAVRDAVVLPHGETADTRMLVAVLLPREDGKREGLVEQVRERLRGTLPDYLVPDLWAAVDDFPLTSNGKVDRRSLLEHAVASSRAVVAGPGAHPMGAEEAELASIWQDILKLDRPAEPHDDFFDLGGHSLLAHRMVSRIRRTMGASIGMDVVFDHPTIAELAEAIRALRATASVG